MNTTTIAAHTLGGKRADAAAYFIDNCVALIGCRNVETEDGDGIDTPALTVRVTDVMPSGPAVDDRSDWAAAVSVLEALAGSGSLWLTDLTALDAHDRAVAAEALRVWLS